MHADIKQVPNRARQEAAALRRLETERFRTGTATHLGVALLPVSITPRVDPRSPSRHLIGFALKGNVPPVAQRLACGVLGTGRQLAAAARTNHNGLLAVELNEGEYSLRCVDDIREPIDVEILLAIGDEQAREQMQAVLEAGELPDALRRSLECGLRELGRSSARPFVDLAALWRRLLAGAKDLSAKTVLEAIATTDPAWRTHATPQNALAGHTDPEKRLPPQATRSTELREGFVCVRQPADSVPYGLAIVSAIDPGNEAVLGIDLLPMPLYPSAREPYRFGAIPAAQLTDHPDPDELLYVAEPATPATLTDFPTAEIEKLLDRPDFQASPALRADVERLLDDMRKGA